MGKFSEHLANPNHIIADGAMGTALQKVGLPQDVAPELWNLEKPSVVQTIHRQYIEAGSDFILTNTFGATRLRLASIGLAGQMDAINRTAVHLARQMAEGAFVVGTIGPTVSASQSDCRATYAEQALVLVEAGVDALLIETMVSLPEARLAIEGIMPLVNIPVMTTLVFDDAGNIGAGITAAEVVNTLWPLGITAIGANCCSSMTGLLKAITVMRHTRPDAILMAKPNAGLPRFEDSKMIYDLDPATLVSYIDAFLALDVRIVGGCCGTTAGHIAALKSGFADKKAIIAKYDTKYN